MFMQLVATCATESSLVIFFNLPFFTLFLSAGRVASHVNSAGLYSALCSVDFVAHMVNCLGILLS